MSEFVEGMPYRCSACEEYTVGTYGSNKLCWECYEAAVQVDVVESVMPYPINWGRIIES